MKRLQDSYLMGRWSCLMILGVALCGTLMGMRDAQDVAFGKERVRKGMSDNRIKDRPVREDDRDRTPEDGRTGLCRIT